jgi:hypothetical protein
MPAMRGCPSNETSPDDSMFSSGSHLAAAAAAAAAKETYVRRAAEGTEAAYNTELLDARHLAHAGHEGAPQQGKQPR